MNAVGDDDDDDNSNKKQAEETKLVIVDQQQQQPLNGGEHSVVFNSNKKTVHIDDNCEIINLNESKLLDVEKDLAADAYKFRGSSISSESLFEKNFVGRYIDSLVNYTDMPQDKGTKKTAKLGTILGVLLPCIQNIFGVIFFIRISWVVGNAGLLEGFSIAFICCMCTFLTSISLSAVATNGKIHSGGPYFIISRNLNATFGGSIGLLFYIGNTIAVSMYTCGACEIFLKYMFQNKVALFGDISESSYFFWHVRIYGTIWLTVLSLCVLVGVKFVSKISPIALCCVLLSILAVFIGIIRTAFVPIDLDMCVLGGRLLTSRSYTHNELKFCTKDRYCLDTNANQTFICPLYNLYCSDGNGSSTVSVSDTNSECDRFWLENNITIRKAFPGFPKAFMDNLFSGYLKVGESNPREKGDFSKGQVVEQDTSTSFLILIGIFFPSVTGILAGCNRSGNLGDASKSIPRGTLTAQILTSIIYILALLCYGVSTDRLALRDKSGLGIDNKLVSATLAWPHPWFVLIGSFFSTSGAGLQSLTSAPRLLQAIANDDIIPFLHHFAPSCRGEPVRALILTVIIAEIGVLIADIDKLTPLVSMFFLLCYAFINFACALQSLMGAPNWRPRFKYYHWSLSIAGGMLCLIVMFIAESFFALIAWVMAILIYLYIHFKGAEKAWGEGLKGLNLSAARYALLQLEDKPLHTKNWRPQVLLCTKLVNYEPTKPELFDFAKQLKAGKGLLMVSNIVERDFLKDIEEVKTVKTKVKEIMKQYGLQGFEYVLTSDKVETGLSYAFQTAGIGPIRPNTIVLGWYNEPDDDERSVEFINLLKLAYITNKAVILMKTKNYPTLPNYQEGTIDMWFIIHDGGLMLQIGYLLSLNRIWKNCKLRLFTVAHAQDNSIKMKADLVTYLDLLRIKASVKVVEMTSEEISAYTYEKTIRLVDRKEAFRMLNIRETPLENLTDSVIDADTKRRNTIEIGFQAESENNEESKQQQQQQDFNHQFTFSPEAWKKYAQNTSRFSVTKVLGKMQSAIQLNEHLKRESGDASLIIINIPTPPKTVNQETVKNYLTYCEELTKDLDRVLLVRGCGTEVITFAS